MLYQWLHQYLYIFHQDILFAIRLSIRHSSTSAINATPSFMVIAKGCAPPMPPRPAVTFNVPFR